MKQLWPPCVILDARVHGPWTRPVDTAGVYRALVLTPGELDDWRRLAESTSGPWYWPILGPPLYVVTLRTETAVLSWNWNSIPGSCVQCPHGRRHLMQYIQLLIAQIMAGMKAGIREALLIYSWTRQFIRLQWITRSVWKMDTAGDHSPVLLSVTCYKLTSWESWKRPHNIFITT